MPEDLFEYAAAREEQAHPFPDVPEWVWEWITVEKWAEFDVWRHTEAGREISNLFMRLSLQLKRRDWETYSAQGIVEQIRWKHNLKHGPDEDGFKVNSKWKRPLSLWAMSRHKALEGFFRMKQRREAAAARLGKWPRKKGATAYCAN